MTITAKRSFLPIRTAAKDLASYAKRLGFEMTQAEATQNLQACGRDNDGFWRALDGEIEEIENRYMRLHA